MVTVKEIFESNTSVVEEAKALLADLADREGQYVWEKLAAENGDFVDYVVADSEDAYPDGGEQDGYWYELLSNPVDLADEADLIAENIRKDVDIFGIIGTLTEGIGAEAFGFSNVDYGTFTVTEDKSVSALQISHNLGVTPKMVIVFCPVNPKNEAYYLRGVIINTNWNTGYGYKAMMLVYQNLETAVGGFDSSYYNLKSSYFIPYTLPPAYYGTGKEYYWFALA